MKNPLHKRYLRELKQDAGKYLVLFLFLTLTIGFVSGFQVADSSMTKAYDESFEKYKIEDGHFTLAVKAEKELKSKLKKEHLKLSEIFYKDVERKNEHSVRIYTQNDDVNKICVMDGKFPKNKDEIIIDRLYAENNGIAIGDKFDVDGKKFTVSGVAAFSNYSALFKNNTDMMFDANKFTVAMVTKKGFERFSDDELHYCYAYRWNHRGYSEQKASDKSDDVKDILKKTGLLTDFAKASDNQAITFTGEDMGGDLVMIITLLYIVMVVLAFVFAVTTRSTIEKEASTIGTLRALGYTRGELIRHYLTLPIWVTLISAVIGNILGYTCMKDVVVDIYYHSYSLPTYETIWNTEAFWLTTVVPCLIVFAIVLLILVSMMHLPPLQFLRHELRKKKKKGVIHLPEFKFFTRFRLRIVFQNISAYLTLFLGVFFASFLLFFGMMMSPLLQNFKTEVIHSEIAKYQYILKAPVQTETKGAEKYAVMSLQTERGEEITVYGVEEDSTYLKDAKIPSGKNKVLLSDGFLEKYGLKEGGKVTLEKKYEDDSYTFTVSGTYDYPATLSVFMSMENFNRIFDYDEDYFNGYFTDKKIKDIDSSMVASIITQDDLTVIADQLEDSMGDMMWLMCAFSVFLYVLVIYLLAKMIVEKNEQSISMIKILGYSDKEAGSLYNRATGAVLVISLLLVIPICHFTMMAIYYVMMQQFNGWLTYYVAPWVYPAMIAIGIVCYLVVHMIQMKRIRRIPMGRALKDME